MGSIRSSNVKRVAREIVENNKEAFTEDFTRNKEVLKTALTSVSKNTLNAIAGYATRTVVKNRMKLQREIEEGTVTV
ncbi:MAG: 30S ribosomal protein S17e [Thermoplasmatales archaeon B_DKE]|nr:MAG: 30S ribosomal protein S17e [Thermoplasmatales archaeon B_DKE]QRF75115.1 30S ribosomal protein S17e [Thermoplasmatales archaeon]